MITGIYTTKPQPNGIFIIDAEIEGLGPNDAREVFKLIHAMLKKDPMKRITLDQLHSKLLEIAKTVDGFEETPEIQLALDVSPS